MSQENEYDIRDQRKILILEMSTNPGGEVVTQILLHSVIRLFPNNDTDSCFDGFTSINRFIQENLIKG